MNVLHVISSGGMYGAERVILTLSQALNQACDASGKPAHRSTVAALRAPGQSNGDLLAAAARAEVPVSELACQGPFDLHLLEALRAEALARGADLIHAHGYKADLYSFFSMNGKGMPLVSTCHTWYDNTSALRVYGVLDRFVLRGFTSVAAVSAEVRQRLLNAGVRASKIRLVTNGIEPGPRRQRQYESASLRVGLVGRLAREKGVDLLIRAAAEVLKEQPGMTFIVAGDGPERAELSQLIDELGLADRVLLPGRVDDMADFYQSLDLLVSASRQEGLPMALLEGMASGLPVVATSVGEVPELVVEGVTGSLVPPERYDLLAAAILDLLRDPQRLHAMGEAARKRIEDRFSAEHMTAEYLALYEEALRGSARQRAQT